MPYGLDSELQPVESCSSVLKFMEYLEYEHLGPVIQKHLNPLFLVSRLTDFVMLWEWPIGIWLNYETLGCSANNISFCVIAVRGQMHMSKKQGRLVSSR
jgi:hypothetical protein